MQKIIIAITAAAIIASAAPRSAVAMPVTYDLNGASVTYSNGATDTLSGSFILDTTTTTLSSINISESGPAPGPNVFNMVNGSTASSISGSSSLDSQILNISFLANLGNASDPLLTVSTSGPSGAFNSISVTGTADPVGAVTPIPPAITLFGSVLALFALFCYRRNLTTGLSFPRAQRYA